jgi:hypothetical protein
MCRGTAERRPTTFGQFFGGVGEIGEHFNPQGRASPLMERLRATPAGGLRSAREDEDNRPSFMVDVGNLVDTHAAEQAHAITERLAMRFELGGKRTVRRREPTPASGMTASRG